MSKSPKFLRKRIAQQNQSVNDLRAELNRLQSELIAIAAEYALLHEQHAQLQDAARRLLPVVLRHMHNKASDVMLGTDGRWHTILYTDVDTLKRLIGEE